MHATDWFDEGRHAARFLVPSALGRRDRRAAYRIPTTAARPPTWSARWS